MNGGEDLSAVDVQMHCLCRSIDLLLNHAKDEEVNEKFSMRRPLKPSTLTRRSTLCSRGVSFMCGCSCNMIVTSGFRICSYKHLFLCLPVDYFHFFF